MFRRICLFGLPRCGSQYIAELIKENSTHKLTDMYEPYTGDSKETNMPLPVLNHDNHIRMEFLDGYVGSDNVQKRLQYIDDILTKNKLQTPALLRLFPYHYLWSSIPSIIQELRNHEFEFFIIKRSNLEHHVLSYLIAQATNQWRTTSSAIIQRVKIDSIYFESIEYIVGNSINFLNYCKQINISGHVITYETAKEDLEKIYKKQFKDQHIIKKQGLNNPYDQIINAEEIKHLIDKSIKRYVTS